MASKRKPVLEEVGNFPEVDWQQVEWWEAAALTPYVANAKEHPPEQVKKLAKAIGEFGWDVPIVVDEAGVILKGHGRRLAALELELVRVPVIVRRGLSEDEKRAIRLSDNKLAESDWIDHILASELQALQAVNFDLELTGFSDADFEALAKELGGEGEGGAGGDGEGGAGGPGGEGDDPEFENELIEIAEGRQPTRVKPGEVWEVADQRLLCGDCRLPESFAGLLQGRLINLGITSPPYAQQRGYDPASGFDPIPASEYVGWYAPIAGNLASHLAIDGSYLLNIKEHSENFLRNIYCKELLIAHVKQWGWSWIDEYVWTHGGIPGSPQKMGKFKNQWEPIYWFAQTTRPKFYPDRVVHSSSSAFLDDNYQSQNAARSQGRGTLMGDRLQGEGKAYPGNVLSLGRNDERCGHAAAFPVALPEFFMLANSDAGDLVFDPFLGSGTTLIAAHKNSRIGLGCELSPAYCEVIIRRLEKLTGEPASRLSF